MEEAVSELSAIAGQKAVITRARKINCGLQASRRNANRLQGNIAQGQDVGFSRQVNEFCPAKSSRFSRNSDRGFDGRGNFTLGVKEHTIFPELEIDRVKKSQGHEYHYSDNSQY